ncbi:Aste57867_23614 [Aphanomyces stellatus]|uniref:Aste57867_23614 protein n=1 Tax=Aphanomyces stellatus TaxID=120398 RepID=A0A485LPU0_9STRA|nr:hypothetical protein As57867_023542 [Aphanomyces stellatus]VFU00259.1 Aste57867_23614 [Aphanomyces stellatus]
MGPAPLPVHGSGVDLPVEGAINNGRPFDIEMAISEIYGLKAHYKEIDGSKEVGTLFRKLFFGIDAFRIFNNSTAHHQQVPALRRDRRAFPTPLEGPLGLGHAHNVTLH